MTVILPTVSKVKLLLQASALLMVLIRPGVPPAPVERLIKELPPCSILRAELQHGAYSSGVEQPYMAKMRQQGVQRALLQLQGVLQGNKLRDIHLVRQLYFRQLDGPNSQISDPKMLNMIRTKGLSAELEELAQIRALKAPLIRGRGWGTRGGTLVEFFANPWILAKDPVIVRFERSSSITDAVITGDVMETQALLKSHSFARKDLDVALFDAVLSRYDNTAVIMLLLDAGADVNARASDGGTPLMSAVPHPCNLRPLLDRGADLNARDKWGRTALEVAREVKEYTAVRILEVAANKQRHQRNLQRRYR